MLRRAVGLRRTALAGAIAALLLHSPEISHAAGVSDTLSFEFPDPASVFAGWHGGPPGTVFPESIVVHGGRFAARFERGPSSPSQFSVLTRSIPVTFQGDSAEVRGWLRTDDVKGFAGLWLREDGPGSTLQFDNMEDRGISGTTPWTEYRIALPLDRRARKIFFGALLGGSGTLRVDDLELLVDGGPAAEAPVLVREPTAVDLDHEFDAGSCVDATKLSAAQVRNVALLAKVWGFLKYHHPRVTDGKLHWDYELFRVLPEILASKGETGASTVLVKWIDRIGAPPVCDSCATLPDSAHLLPGVAWIRDRRSLGADLSARLERIYVNRDADREQYYVEFPDGGYIPKFASERAYAGAPLPDPGYRLLGLFRFWNIVEYWFPYRDLIPESWDRVLEEFISRVVAAGDLEAYRLAMLALTARARDGHASVWNAIDSRPPRGGCQLPIAVRSVERRFVVSAIADSTLAAASGMAVGDAILALDGKPVEASSKGWVEYIGASNEAARRREVARFLTRGTCGPCRVTVERAGKRLELMARRDSTGLMDPAAGATNDLPGPTFRLLDSDVAYLKLSSFKQSEVGSYIERAAGTKCLVIDIRNYPSEFAPFALGGHFVEGETPFARFTRGDLTNPGAFLWTDLVRIPPVTPRYEGTVVILVDERSQSQSEYTAMAFRAAPGAIVVGSTTAGADGNLALIPLPGGLRTSISGIGVFYPDRRPTQQVGIVPDLIVTPTIEGIRAGRDEVLEAAIRKAVGREMKVWRR